MKSLISLIILILSFTCIAQTADDVQGIWYYKSATFSGTDAEFMTDEQKTPPCATQLSMEFNPTSGMATLTNFLEPDCIQKETKSVPFKIEDGFIVLSLNQSERKMEIHSFSDDQIVLIPYIDDQNLTIHMTMVKMN